MSENYWDKLMATDEGAATYMESYGEGPGSETRQIISGFINDGESVLDVGCGPGWNLDHFMEYGPAIKRYRGIDYSERFVRVANERAMAKAGTATGPFELGDCRKLKAYNSQYDVVIIQDCLEHTDGYEKPMEEAMRVAKKRVIVTFWRGQMRDDFENDDGENHVRDDGDDGFCGEYSRKAWEKYLDTLGFMWAETQTSPEANRWHRYYVIDKEEPR